MVKCYRKTILMKQTDQSERLGEVESCPYKCLVGTAFLEGGQRRLSEASELCAHVRSQQFCNSAAES